MVEVTRYPDDGMRIDFEIDVPEVYSQRLEVGAFQPGGTGNRSAETMMRVLRPLGVHEPPVWVLTVYEIGGLETAVRLAVRESNGRTRELTGPGRPPVLPDSVWSYIVHTLERVLATEQS